jgi:hypothetical protein
VRLILFALSSIDPGRSTTDKVPPSILVGELWIHTELAWYRLDSPAYNYASLFAQAFVAGVTKELIVRLGSNANEVDFRRLMERGEISKKSGEEGGPHPDLLELTVYVRKEEGNDGPLGTASPCKPFSSERR